MNYSNQDDLFYDEHQSTISPTQALFPAELTTPYNPSSNHLNVPSNNRLSFSSDSYSSGYPNTDTLSPSSQSAPSLQHGQGSSIHSPHSSASPHSAFAVDDLFFGQSFTASDLDLFLAQADLSPQQPAKNGLFLPDTMYGNLNNPYGNNHNQIDDDPFDMLNMVNASPSSDRRFSVASVPESLSYQANLFNPGQMRSSVPQFQQQPQYQPTTIQPQWFEQNKTQLSQTFSQVPPPQPSRVVQAQPVPTAQPVKPLVAPRRSAPNKPLPRRAASAEKSSASPPDGTTAAIAPVGKHNKTERRYRQKVQAAQTDLRDAVPALRVLYGTSTEEQKLTTDIRDPEGRVDGLGHITRPNASAKATILIGARMYIELLQARSAMLARKVSELETWRAAVGGMDDLASWQADFEVRESAYTVISKSGDEDASSEEDDSEEEKIALPKKRARAVPKKSAKVKSEDMGGVRVFAAFAMSFSMVPSASTLLRSTNVDLDVTPGHVLSGKITPTEVISRLPLITAEHTSRLLSRGLPSMLVPHPHTMVDWTWRLLVALVLIVLLGPFVARWSRDEETGAGSLFDILKEGLKLVIGSRDGQDEVWTVLAANILGGIITPTRLVRLHVAIHLHRTATDAYSLALLALLRVQLPFVRKPEALWAEARNRLCEDDPPALQAVLALPFEEAVRSLDLLAPTNNPIGAIAEQVTLVHLNDLYTRLFIRLVDATTQSTGNPPPQSVKSLLANLESKNLGITLNTSSFDSEIRAVVEGVPKGSASHALGLVLIGLWGVFTGPTPSAQAALASALAAEEMQGAGGALSSVSGMLELLYPGSSSPQHKLLQLPQNALALDKLALVCIDYIRLLSSARSLNEATENQTRLQRLEASQKVQKATSQLRLILTQAHFQGLDVLEEEEEIEEDFDMAKAKERLVGVLAVIGRRAAGRSRGRDEDSGLEGDLDEL